MRTRALAAWFGTGATCACLGLLFQPKTTEPHALATGATAPARVSAPLEHIAPAAFALPSRREPIVVTDTDPFETLAPAPAPLSRAPATPPAPPPTPTAPEAPPLPYRYSGTMIDVSGMTTVYLARGAKVFPVQAGDTIEGGYHVDTIDEKEIALTYLPLHATLSLRRISAAN